MPGADLCPDHSDQTIARLRQAGAGNVPAAAVVLERACDSARGLRPWDHAIVASLLERIAAAAFEPGARVGNCERTMPVWLARLATGPASALLGSSAR